MRPYSRYTMTFSGSIWRHRPRTMCNCQTAATPCPMLCIRPTLHHNSLTNATARGRHSRAPFNMMIEWFNRSPDGPSTAATSGRTAHARSMQHGTARHARHAQQHVHHLPFICRSTCGDKDRAGELDMDLQWRQWRCYMRALSRQELRAGN